ncbi:hypothetical protein AB1Y20_009523 [Prymnesium parvum]|uniref:Uncharacterized protein n=1 Tax=Prymnesium parvum TaxID=97485 RepID=A0AB34K4P9_PRYPA
MCARACASKLSSSGGGEHTVRVEPAPLHTLHIAHRRQRELERLHRRVDPHREETDERGRERGVQQRVVQLARAACRQRGGQRLQARHARAQHEGAGRG